MESASRLKIVLWPSRRLVLLLGAGHLGAALAVFVLDIPLLAEIAVGAVIVANAGYQITRVALLRTGASITALELDRDGGIAFATRGGEWEEAELLGTSFVSSPLIVLNLRMTRTRAVRHAVLMDDSADPESLRELRVLLRWGRQRQPSR